MKHVSLRDMPDAVLLFVLLRVVQDATLLFPVELLLLEVDFQDTFDHNEGKPSDQHPLEVVPNGVEEDSAHDGGNGGKQKGTAEHPGGGQRIGRYDRSRRQWVCCRGSASIGIAGEGTSAVKRVVVHVSERINFKNISVRIKY